MGSVEVEHFDFPATRTSKSINLAHNIRQFVRIDMRGMRSDEFSGITRSLSAAFLVQG